MVECNASIELCRLLPLGMGLSVGLLLAVAALFRESYRQFGLRKLLISSFFFIAALVSMAVKNGAPTPRLLVPAPADGGAGVTPSLRTMPVTPELAYLDVLDEDPFPAWTNAVTNVCVTGFQSGPTSALLRVHLPANTTGSARGIEVYARTEFDEDHWSGVGWAQVPRRSDTITIEIPHTLLPYGGLNSMFFLLSTDLDSDSDFLSDAFEIFVTGTDPGLVDTDFDGLDDWTEVFETLSDPNDPGSINGVCSDAFAYMLDGYAPNDEVGGGYTALETLFYTGSVYGHVYNLPESTDSSAVLEVSAVGAGVADLVVGGTVVPLVAGMPPLKLSVPRGVRQNVEFRGDPSVRAQLDSLDFCIGELPGTRGVESGWIAFPFVEPTHPCIHDSRTTTVEVSLDPGPDIEGLTCTWTAGTPMRNLAAGAPARSGLGGDSVTVVNHPPLSASITASFPRDGSCEITYTLHHDRYLFGTATFSQTCEFCPKIIPEGFEDFYDAYQDYPDDPSQDPQRESDERYRYCYEHNCWYWNCLGQHGQASESGEYDELDPTPAYVESCSNAYENAVHNPNRFTDVLKLHRPQRADDMQYINVEVPPDGYHCCRCPEHWEGFVSLLQKNRRVSVRRGAEPFERTTEDCLLQVRGVSPSDDFEDAVVSLCRTGVVYEAHYYTVFGVSILSELDDGVLATLNEHDDTFGLPVVANTNLDRAVCLRFRTDVNLPTGTVRLAIENAETRMQLWMWTRTGADGPPRYVKVVDSETKPSLNMSITDWKNYVENATVDRETTMRLVVFGRGKGRIVFGYAGGKNGQYLSDEAVQMITSVPTPLLPDYNRDGIIDDADDDVALGGGVFRFWMNEDCDKGDFIGQISDDDANVEYKISGEHCIGGKFDLVNLFPVRLDVRQIARALGSDAEIEILAGGGSLRYCIADVQPDQVAKFYRDNVPTVQNWSSSEMLENAVMRALPSVETSLQALGCGNYRNVRRVLALEAVGPVGQSESPEIAVWLHGHPVLSYRMPCSIQSVREMYRWINARHLSDEDETRPSDTAVPRNNPGVANACKRLVFLHGADVSEANAEKWGDQIFKRLWLSGADIDFYNVDWRSDMGLTGANYQQNASNAFEVASRLVSTIAAIPGPKVIMAHSLGNMVVSSMIQDYGLTVEKYFMCNSAVPAEAYDASPLLRVPQLVHPEWEEYPTNTWAASYHSLFDGMPNDDRRLLGWPGRFSDVAQYAVNFYSTGDEVLELYENNNVTVVTGIFHGGLIDPDFGHLSWHKQELFKGRAILGTQHWGATHWSGWGFSKVESDDGGEDDGRKYTSIEARDLLETQLRSDPVFNPYPASITNSVIPLLVRAAHLTQGVPSLTQAAGRIRFQGPIMANGTNFDENQDDEGVGIVRYHGWPLRSDYPMRWLHSDMKDVAFWYNYKLYDKFIEVGGLK